jgi:hypothetical protein
MALSQTKSYFQWTKIALANAGVLLVLSPSIFLPLPSVAQSAPQTPRITCSDSDNFFANGFTDKHDIQICGNSSEKYSMIVQSIKSSSPGIKIDARPLDDSKNVFEAKAGKVTYTLDINKREFKIVEIQIQPSVRPLPAPWVPGRPKPKPAPFTIKTTIEKINGLLIS